MLEEGSFRGRQADFVYMFILGALFMVRITVSGSLSVLFVFLVVRPLEKTKILRNEKEGKSIKVDYRIPFR